jgi:exopolysaccharide biosynthesis protein
MLAYGAVNATTLDGVLYYYVLQREVIHNPSNPLGERLVPQFFIENYM